jgi:type II secretory pathway pseudopilin PulG
MLKAASPTLRSRVSRSGFSLVELLILVAAALVVAGLSVPVLRGITLATNEESAHETLVRLRDFQIRFREKGVANLENGGARFGTFAELVRAGLSLEDAEVSSDGNLMLRHGYCFQFQFATKSRDFTTKPNDPAAGDAKDGFLIYAWPEIHGRSGSGAFVIDPSSFLRPTANLGILESKNILMRYSGRSHAPQPFAAARTGDAGPANANETVEPTESTESSKSSQASKPLKPKRNEYGEDGELWELVPFPANQ